MKARILYLLCLVAAFALKAAPLCAQQQQPKAPPSPAEFAEQEVSRLEKLLKLDEYQAFYVDSILQHDMQGMMDEIQEMQRAGMQEMSSFRIVQDRWRKQIEAAYQKIFTPEQWEKYLIDSGQKKSDKKKSREERRRKREEERMRKNREKEMEE